MPTFPQLFQLPAVPLKLVLSLISALELLELSQCSSQTRRFLRSALLADHSALSIVYNPFAMSPRYGCRALCTIKNARATRKFEIRVYCDGAPECPERVREAREQQVLGRTFKMIKTEHDVEIFILTNFVKAVAWFADHLFDVFNVERSNFDVQSSLNPHRFGEYKEWEGSREVGYWQESGYFSCDTLAEFLRHHSRGGARRSVSFFGDLSDPENLSPAHFPAFDYFRAHSVYVCPEILFGLDARVISIVSFDGSETPLTSEHFNAFIKKWLDDVEFHKNLEILVAGSQYRDIGFSKEDAFRGIQLMEPSGAPFPNLSSFPKDFRRFYNKIINETMGNDIRRAADGRVATLFLAEKAFIFVVRS